MIQKEYKVCRVYPVFQDDLWYTEHYLAKELKKDGISTTFVTSDHYRKAWKNYLTHVFTKGYYEFECYNVFRLRALFPLEQTVFIDLFRLYHLLYKSNNSVIHINSYGTITTVQALTLSLFAKKRPPIIFSDHTNSINHSKSGLFAELFYFFLALIMKLFIKRFHYIITYSESSKNLISKRFKLPLNRFFVIPLGYDQDVYFRQPNHKNRESKFIIGFAGKINHRKRIDFLVQQLATHDLISRVKLIIVGVTNDPYCDMVRSLAENSGLETEFRPFAKAEELSLFYNYIDLAVFPGSISITTIEANGCGTPVLLYKSIEGLEERIENGRGMLFSNDIEFISCIKQYLLLYDSGAIDNASIENVTKSRYSWTVIKNQYKSVYDKCLDYAN